MNAMQVWAEAWQQAKMEETAATIRRRAVEDKMLEAMQMDQSGEDTTTVKPADGIEVKIIRRIDRKVDADKLQEIAIEHGLMDHLSSLFRWKPEINATAWKQADPAIVRPLADAITAKPGRPSFKITIAN
jgi:hypothetical protein